VREVHLATESWDLQAPFRITGRVFTGAHVLCVTIVEDGHTGRGEASGVYYFGEDAASMLAQAESVRRELVRGAGRERLRDLLPAGGARNAIDCALWDLEAKRSGKSIWELTGITPREVTTFETVGIDTPEAMAARARSLRSPCLKVKLDGDAPLERITAVRAARPDAQIIVDANQGWNFAQLREFAPGLHAARVAMIEQPLPRGEDEALEGFALPLPLCADESCVDTGEFEQAARRYQLINIKLDKTGGLTEALELARMARDRGVKLMVGNMLGTSLAMAPGYVIAQLCRFVDLDGPLYLTRDREHALACHDGRLEIPRRELWG
jgi:L-alanine-DL-glutamate epimerase-like enolase superfamily enzyme